jgi:FkbM family methyltransferase
VLFLDIGADLGSYSVLVANKFKNSPVAVKTFEPISESCALIEENIRKNSIEEYVTIYPCALANENNDNATIELNCDTPGSSTMKDGAESKSKKQIHIKTRKLDDIINKEIGKFDSIIFKIDVEGMERDVILGAQKIIHSQKEIYLMVEDFIDPKIIDYLHECKWDFVKKLTSYNSWWFFKTQ